MIEGSGSGRPKNMWIRSRVSFLFSVPSAGALVCLDAASEPAGEGQGPHWSPPFHEEIFPHGAGMCGFSLQEF
jgi:hypothetical protein